VVTSRVTVVVVVTGGGGGSSAQPISASGNASEQILIFINVSFLLIRFARAFGFAENQNQAGAQAIAQSRF
jgi:hypothetical protein